MAEEKKNLLEITILSAPRTSSLNIVLPYDYPFQNFDTATVPNSFGDSKQVNYNEVTMVLDELKKCPEYNFENKKSCLESYMVITVFIMFGLMAVGTVASGGAAAPFLMVTWFVASVSIMFCSKSCSNRKAKITLTRRCEEFQEVIEKFNNNYFLKKGVKWSVGTYGAWLKIEMGQQSIQEYTKYEQIPSNTDGLAYGGNVNFQPQNVNYRINNPIDYPNEVAIAKPDNNNYAKI